MKVRRLRNTCDTRVVTYEFGFSSRRHFFLGVEYEPRSRGLPEKLLDQSSYGWGRDRPMDD